MRLRSLDLRARPWVWLVPRLLRRPNVNEWCSAATSLLLFFHLTPAELVEPLKAVEDRSRRGAHLYATEIRPQVLEQRGELEQAP